MVLISLSNAATISSFHLIHLTPVVNVIPHMIAIKNEGSIPLARDRKFRKLFLKIQPCVLAYLLLLMLLCVMQVEIMSRIGQ